MIRLECDYAEGAHERVLRRLFETNLEQTPGYDSRALRPRPGRGSGTCAATPTWPSTSWWGAPRPTPR